MSFKKDVALAGKLIQFHHAYANLVQLYNETPIEEMIIGDDKVCDTYVEHYPFNVSLFDYNVYGWVTTSLEMLGMEDAPLRSPNANINAEGNELIGQFRILITSLNIAFQELSTAWAATLHDFSNAYPFELSFDEMAIKVNIWVKNIIKATDQKTYKD
jgi:hypothetical protein